jgi:hypothetical protein
MLAERIEPDGSGCPTHHCLLGDHLSTIVDLTPEEDAI